MGLLRKEPEPEASNADATVEALKQAAEAFTKAWDALGPPPKSTVGIQQRLSHSRDEPATWVIVVDVDGPLGRSLDLRAAEPAIGDAIERLRPILLALASGVEISGV